MYVCMCLCLYVFCVCQGLWSVVPGNGSTVDDSMLFHIAMTGFSSPCQCSIFCFAVDNASRLFCRSIEGVNVDVGKEVSPCCLVRKCADVDAGGGEDVGLGFLFRAICFVFATAGALGIATAGLLLINGDGDKVVWTDDGVVLAGLIVLGLTVVGLSRARSALSLTAGIDCSSTVVGTRKTPLVSKSCNSCAPYG